MQTDIKSLIMAGAQIADDERKAAFGFDRSKYFNSSESGSCLRRVWYDKHQPEHGEPQSWGYARRGVSAEGYVVDMLRRANVPLIMAGDDQESVQDDELMLSATGDGVLEYPREWEPIEVKSIDPRTNKGRLPKGDHIDQFRIAMALLKRHRLPKGIQIKTGWLIYIDASNYDDLIVVPVAPDDSILERMARRGARALRAKSADALEREGRANGGDECRKRCPYRQHCGVDVEADAAPKRANRGSNLDADAQVYLDLKDKIDAAKEAQDTVRESIKRELKKRKTNSTVVGDIRVELKETAGRTSLDKKAAKAAGIDLSPYEKTGDPGERLTLELVT